MKEQSEYDAKCCGVSMYNMGLWPRRAMLAKESQPEKDGSTVISFDEEGIAYCTTYHCKQCGRYIGIAWEQEPHK